MKKVVMILMIFILCGCQNVEEKVKSVNTLVYDKNEFEYGDLIKISELFKNDYTFEDNYLDTSVLGEHTINVNYEFEEKKYSEKYNYTIVDTTEPLIMIGDTYYVNVNSDDTLLEDIICADNYDSDLECIITGDYDLNTIGSYSLTITAIDVNNNKEEVEFTLNVVPQSTPSYSDKRTPFEDIVNLHKNENTMIGIDVSRHQGDINWEEVKNAGVEFAMIRLGYQDGFNGEYGLDAQFLNNIEGALANNLKVGIYFYSYADSVKEAKKQAKFVADNLKNYNVEMPIAFDWENFKKFNSLNLSIYNLREISYAFQDELVKYGYRPVQYGSKNYLNYFWNPTKYETWLAHYIEQTTYEGNFVMWQLCDNGIVPGIDAPVDIDIYYK